MAKKKLIQYGVQLAVGLGISVAVMWGQGAFEAVGTADRLLAVCNGFSVTSLLYLCFGGLAWVSTTGVLDIFSYAVRKGAHFLIPAMGREDVGKYYEYKMQKAEKRRNKTHWSGLIVGLVFLAVSIALTAAWYAVAG